MPIQDCVISTEMLSGQPGDVIPSGVVNLTITPQLGTAITASELLIGGATAAGGNEWIGGNVTAGVIKVVFSNNANGTVNAAVHHSGIVFSGTTTDLHIDIDRKSPPPHGDEGEDVEVNTGSGFTLEFHRHYVGGLSDCSSTSTNQPGVCASDEFDFYSVNWNTLGFPLPGYSFTSQSSGNINLFNPSLSYTPTPGMPPATNNSDFVESLKHDGDTSPWPFPTAILQSGSNTLDVIVFEAKSGYYFNSKEVIVSPLQGEDLSLQGNVQVLGYSWRPDFDEYDADGRLIKYGVELLFTPAVNNPNVPNSIDEDYPVMAGWPSNIYGGPIYIFNHQVLRITGEEGGVIDHTVSNVTVGNKSLMSLPTSTDLTIRHSVGSSFRVIVSDEANRRFYSFSENKFKSGKEELIVENSSTGITKRSIYFPRVTSSTRYRVYLEPLGNVKLGENIPTELNPLYIDQLIKTDLSFNVTATGSWTLPSNITLSGRPGGETNIKNSESFGYKSFSLVATYTGGGGKSLRVDFQPSGSIASMPAVGGTVFGEEINQSSGFIPNNIEFSKMTVSVDGNDVTLAGIAKVRRFGSINETINLDLDKIISIV